MKTNNRRKFLIKFGKKYDKYIKVVLPTQASLKYNKVRNEFVMFDHNEQKRGIVETGDKILQTDHYAKISISLIHTVLNYPAALQVVNYIAANIEKLSNVITFTLDDIKTRLKVDKRTVLSAIDFLCEKEVIWRTNIKSTYVVDHNKILYGSLDDFVSIYNELYDNKYAKYDSNEKKLIVTELVDKNECLI